MSMIQVRLSYELRSQVALHTLHCSCCCISSASRRGAACWANFGPTFRFSALGRLLRAHLLHCRVRDPSQMPNPVPRLSAGWQPADLVLVLCLHCRILSRQQGSSRAATTAWRRACAPTAVSQGSLSPSARLQQQHKRPFGTPTTLPLQSRWSLLGQPLTQQGPTAPLLLQPPQEQATSSHPATCSSRPTTSRS